MTNKEKKDIIEYTGIHGYVKGEENEYIFFDDEDELKDDERLKYKIIKIKIYTKFLNKKNVIIGLEYSLRNLFNGKEVVISHKTSKEFDDFKELKINSNEYLKELIMRYPNSKDEYITQLGFATNKNNKILAGEEEGELKKFQMNEGKNVIISTYGYLGKNLISLGCYYVPYDKLASSILFRFFMLRHLVKKDESFKKVWDDKYEALPLDYKFLWKMINLPENLYVLVAKMCL